VPDRFFCISMWLPAGYVNFLVKTLLKLKVTDKAIDSLRRRSARSDPSTRAGYRELRRRGVSAREAWNMSKSAHGPWRLSRTPALTLTLPARYFSCLGLPEYLLSNRPCT
jgi:hypothetical protein